MSLYRELGRVRPAKLALTAAVGLLVGGVIGFALGGTASEEPSLRESMQKLQADLRPALGALELVTIEYPEAVRDGRVVAKTEYAAARSQLGTASEAIAASEEELEVLDSEGARALDASLGRLHELVKARGSGEQVRREAEASSAILRRILRV
jgi:hypothetical protein